jgi:hypothetical protein
MHHVIYKVLYGEIDIDDVDIAMDDAVEAWHLDRHTQQAIWEYLGMTHEEYGRWVENPRAILDIIEERRKQLHP